MRADSSTKFDGRLDLHIWNQVALTRVAFFTLDRSTKATCTLIKLVGIIISPPLLISLSLTLTVPHLLIHTYRMTNESDWSDTVKWIKTRHLTVVRLALIQTFTAPLHSPLVHYRMRRQFRMVNTLLSINYLSSTLFSCSPLLPLCFMLILFYSALSSVDDLQRSASFTMSMELGWTTPQSRAMFSYSCDLSCFEDLCRGK